MIKHKKMVLGLLIAFGLGWLTYGSWSGRLLLIGLLIVGLSFVGSLMLFGLWIYSIYDRVRRCPKGEMYLCHRHGPIFLKDTIRFLDRPYCPRCFHENLQRAEQIGVKDYMNRHYPGKVQ
jgi:hypothetical protein